MPQGATSSLSATHPLWILGHEYNLLGKGGASAGDTELDEEASLLLRCHKCSVCRLPGPTSDQFAWRVQVVSQVLEDFGSRVWMTYRRDFPPIGALDTARLATVQYGAAALKPRM